MDQIYDQKQEKNVLVPLKAGARLTKVQMEEIRRQTDDILEGVKELEALKFSKPKNSSPDEQVNNDRDLIFALEDSMMRCLRRKMDFFNNRELLEKDEIKKEIQEEIKVIPFHDILITGKKFHQKLFKPYSDEHIIQNYLRRYRVEDEKIIRVAEHFLGMMKLLMKGPHTLGIPSCAQSKTKKVKSLFAESLGGNRLRGKPTLSADDISDELD